MKKKACERIEEKIESFLYCSSPVIFIARLKKHNFESFLLKNRIHEFFTRIIECELMIKEEIQDAYSAKKITWDEYNRLWERVLIERQKLLVCHYMLVDETEKSKKR